jgi:hypothetical protein
MAAEAVRESLRRLTDEMRTLREVLGSMPMGEEAHPWSVVASHAIMEGFHTFGIEQELRPKGFQLPDITAGTFAALKRLTQIADTALKQQEAEATDPETRARIKEDRDHFGHVQLRFGIVRSLIPAGPPIDYTPRPEMVADVDAVMATAWAPPAEADEASVLKADAEARRFMAEWDRLSDKIAPMNEGDQNQVHRLSDHRDILIQHILEAPVASPRTAATVMRVLLDEQGHGYSIADMGREPFEHVRAWLTTQAEQRQS